MRYALIATTVLCAFALGTYACGGDDDNAANNTSTPLDGGSSGNASSSTGGIGSSSSSSTGGVSSSSSSTGGSSTSSSSSSTSSTGGVTPADAGDVGDASEIPDSGGSIGDASATFDGAAGSLCQKNSVQETEDNGTTPNTIPGKTGTFCGSISTAGDVDQVSFVLPADATTLDISTSAAANGYQLSGTVGTTTFALTGADAGNFPFVPGGTYTLKATAANGATVPIDYIIGITITEEPAGGSLCENGSQPEVEPNDDDAHATPITITNGVATWCGSFSSTTDVDEFKFTMPSGFTHLSTTFNTSTGSGTDFVIGLTDNGATANPSSINITPGDVYIFKFTSDIANLNYIYRLTLTP